MAYAPVTECDVEDSVPGEDGRDEAPAAGGAAGTSLDWSKPAMAREAWLNLKLALPVCGSFVLSMSLGVVTILVVGHLGEVALGGAALANMYVNVTGFSIGIGALTALDTLAAQAYGAGRHKLLGVYLQRSLAILAVFSVAVLVAWRYTYDVLLALGQEEPIAAAAQLYVDYFSPGFYPFMVFETQKRYLQAQGDTRSPMWVMLAVAVVHPCLALALVGPAGMGFAGAPLSMALSAALEVLLMTAVIVCRGLHRETWGGWTMDAFRGWGAYLKLGGPGILMICMEWMSFEVCSLLAGWLGAAELAAQAIVINTLSLAFMLPLGLSVAASIRVGNFLGAGQAGDAKRSAAAVMSLTAASQTLVGVALFLGRRGIALAYTDEHEVVALVDSLLLVVAFFALPDGTQGVLSGILRGCGRQLAGGLANVAAYAVIGLPIAFALALNTDLGLDGIWIGLSAASVTQVTALGVLVLRTDWAETARDAVARVAADASHVRSAEGAGGDADTGSLLRDRDCDNEGDVEASAVGVELAPVRQGGTDGSIDDGR